MKDIRDLTLDGLKTFLLAKGQPGFCARQIFGWIYKKGADSFGAMANLSLPLRGLLKESFYMEPLKLIRLFSSRDKTEKFIFGLGGEDFLESVIIPADGRITACLSTALGCKFACAFCASGLGGFKRNLTTAEIIAQILYLNKHLGAKKLTHIVFMGIGEPFDNYDNILKAIRIINSSEAFRIGSRRLTISTCGIIPGIKRLADEGLQVELSVSLHAADDKTRSMLMPVNKKYPLKDLIAACRDYVDRTNRQITFEYILIKGINSNLSSAGKLAALLKGFNLCKVNLIPANPVQEYKTKPPDKSEALLFKDYLLKHGVNAVLRRPRGKDIDAACGQLRMRYVGKK